MNKVPSPNSSARGGPADWLGPLTGSDWTGVSSGAGRVPGLESETSAGLCKGGGATRPDAELVTWPSRAREPAELRAADGSLTAPWLCAGLLPPVFCA